MRDLTIDTSTLRTTTERMGPSRSPHVRRMNSHTCRRCAVLAFLAVLVGVMTAVFVLFLTNFCHECLTHGGTEDSSQDETWYDYLSTSGQAICTDAIVNQGDISIRAHQYPVGT